jgi:hypothetical protein
MMRRRSNAVTSDQSNDILYAIELDKRAKDVEKKKEKKQVRSLYKDFVRICNHFKYLFFSSNDRKPGVQS